MRITLLTPHRATSNQEHCPSGWTAKGLQPHSLFLGCRFQQLTILLMTSHSLTPHVTFTQCNFKPFLHMHYLCKNRNVWSLLNRMEKMIKRYTSPTSYYWMVKASLGKTGYLQTFANLIEFGQFWKTSPGIHTVLDKMSFLSKYAHSYI